MLVNEKKNHLMDCLQHSEKIARDNVGKLESDPIKNLN